MDGLDSYTWPNQNLMFGKKNWIEKMNLKVNFHFNKK
jgi:hypothetical protein